MDELIEAFDVKGINKAPGIFDVNKLTWFNAHYIRELPFEKYLELVTPWFDSVFDGMENKPDYRRLAELMQGRTEVFGLVPGMVAFLRDMPEYSDDLYFNKKMKTSAETAGPVLEMIRPVLEGIEDWKEDIIHDRVMEKIAESGMKNGTVLWPLRIAISGLANTPGGAFEIAYLLGKDETLRRLDGACARLKKA